MKLLLDTHTLIWHALNDPRLSEAAGSMIRDPSVDVAVSIASLWEIGIKSGAGKWALPVSTLGLAVAAKTLDIEIVPITIEAIDRTESMDMFNKDPFDRMIAATAITRGDILVTIEVPFRRWGVSTLW